MRYVLTGSMLCCAIGGTAKRNICKTHKQWAVSARLVLHSDNDDLIIWFHNPHKPQTHYAMKLRPCKTGMPTHSHRGHNLYDAYAIESVENMCNRQSLTQLLSAKYLFYWLQILETVCVGCMLCKSRMNALQANSSLNFFQNSRVI